MKPTNIQTLNNLIDNHIHVCEDNNSRKGVELYTEIFKEFTSLTNSKFEFTESLRKELELNLRLYYGSSTIIQLEMLKEWREMRKEGNVENLLLKILTPQ